MQTGLGTVGLCYTSRSEDVPGEKLTFGGGFSFARFSLRFFYEEYQRHHNWWTSSNLDLDLVRYLGTTVRFYREEDTSWIINYSLETPMQTTMMSYMATHPLVMLLNKKHILVPSLKSRPGGKAWVSRRIPPPRLMFNKWYFSMDFCDVGLFLLRATAIDFENAWLDPSKVSPVVHFKILDRAYFHNISIATDKQNERKKIMQKILSFDSINGGACAAAKNLWTTSAQNNWGQMKKATSVKPWSFELLCSKEEWQDNDATNLFLKNAQEEHTKLQKMHDTVYSKGLPGSNDGTVYFKWGWMSFLFMSSGRLDPEIPGPYKTIGYNPQTDAGLGNMIWIQPLTNGTAEYKEPQSRYAIKDQPLWLSLFGYYDLVIKMFGSADVVYSYYLCIRSPYTWPKLQVSTNPAQGEIPYSANFGEGRMPQGLWPPPMHFRAAWYLCLFHQREMMETIVSSGPFIPKNYQYKSRQLTMGYSSRWLWGGNLHPTKQVQDPCSGGRHELPDPDRKHMGVQIVDPGEQVPELIFHSWDWRRDAITNRALKRVSNYPTVDEYLYAGPPKHPRTDVLSVPGSQGERPASEGWLFPGLQNLLQRQREEEEGTEPWTESPPPEEDPEQQQQRQQLGLERHLLRQLQQQREQQALLQKAMQSFFSRLVRTECQVQLDPRLLQ